MTSLFVFALAATCASAPSGEEIAQRLAARAASDAASSFSTVYRKEDREEDITDPNASHLDSSTVWRLEGNGYRFIQTPVERSGKRVRSARGEVKTADARRQFVARYTLVPTDPCSIIIGKRRYWVVAFAPRTTGPQPTGNEEDDLLNRLSGTLFIDADRWYVRYAYGELRTPFRVGFGLGKVQRATVWMEQSDTDGVPMLEHVAIDAQVQVFLQGTRRIRRIYQVFPQSALTPRLSPQ